MNGIPVREVMVADVAFVSIPGSRDMVLKTLKERHVSGVPVVKGGELVGMVTRTDLLRNPEEDQTALLMTRDPLVVHPDDSIVEAAKLLAENDIRRLPAVEDGALVGIVSVADIIRMMADLDIKRPIERYFEKTAVALWDEMPLPVAGSVMEYADVQASPVIDSDLNLVGIVSDRDLINASVIEDSVEVADMSSPSDEDEWTWESTRDTLSFYYGVSRIALRKIPVKQAMVPAVTAIKSSKVSECAKVMRKEKIDQLPVVTAHQKLAGMLKDSDLLWALIEHSLESEV
ncbi:CBS domain-containing protein [Candidatus Methanocrinis natronophilus]|uniref:CBS domain-containing protein n=1 Tax=Candidatus Methanocrinis natronophilus TaxID=3033396 RepID=A0ABT5X8I4_9EURY|nr:CBS domain-containing protein [Candidatus Methanocrinis natronophilus]MDF0591007.1 CBS domain-containing protein [Candidatus Methanocrinis natronophilus]